MEATRKRKAEQANEARLRIKAEMEKLMSGWDRLAKGIKRFTGNDLVNGRQLVSRSACAESVIA